MTLSPSEWIHCGTGVLFAPPFLSRWLLYRIFEQSCSVLIYHNDTSETRIIEGFEIGGVKLSGAISVGQHPTSVYIHFLGNPAASVAELLASPAASRPLSSNISEAGPEGLVVNVVPHKLSVKQMLIFGGDGERLEYPITGSNYSVQSIIELMSVGGSIAGDVPLTTCWRVSLSIDDRPDAYSIESTRDWSVAAVDLEEAAFEKRKLVLQRSNGIGLPST